MLKEDYIKSRSSSDAHMLDVMAESDDEILEIANDHEKFTFSLPKIGKKFAKPIAYFCKNFL